MSKELEALNGIKKVLAKYISEKTGVSEEKHFEYLQYDTEISIVAKALTPPTAEEVCKALSEYLQREVKMDSDNTFYYTEQRQIGECDEIICGYGWENEHHTIAFEFDLPPHLITLIGRFYEGLEELE